MITWKIEQTDYLISDGFITTAHWRANAVDGDYTATAYGAVGFGELASPKIPYDQVTEQEVLDWCWASGVDKDAIETNLATQIEALQNPVQDSGLPWG